MIADHADRYAAPGHERLAGTAGRVHRQRRRPCRGAGSGALDRRGRREHRGARNIIDPGGVLETIEKRGARRLGECRASECQCRTERKRADGLVEAHHRIYSSRHEAHSIRSIPPSAMTSPSAHEAKSCARACVVPVHHQLPAPMGVAAATQNSRRVVKLEACSSATPAGPRRVAGGGGGRRHPSDCRPERGPSVPDHVRVSVTPGPGVHRTFPRATKNL